VELPLRTRASVACLALSLAAPAARAAGADPAARLPRAENWDVWGEARLRALALTPVFEGAPGEVVMSRLVLGGQWTPSRPIRLELEAEALSGWVAGDATSVGREVAARPFPQGRDGTGDLTRVVPRRARLLWTTPVGLLSAGAQTFTWGTGMLANDGAGDRPFGDPWLGNAVARLAFATRPLEALGAGGFAGSTALFVAGDYVLRDDNASVYDGDRAFAGIAGLRAEHGGHIAGLLFSARHQRDREDRSRPDGARAETTAYVLDAHGRVALLADGAHHLAIEGEVAEILGETTRPWSDATVPGGAALRQTGAVLRARWDHDPTRVTASVEGGYASGDDAPRDDVVRTFTMHTDHDVGLVLFDQVLPLLSARSVDRLQDPSLTAVPPAATRYAVNPGAVQNAFYVQPVVKLRPLPPLDLRLGYVFATPAGALADPYQTALNGGFATSAGGRVHSRGAYGHEVDARATWDVDLGGPTRLRVGAEGGVFLPGAAFEGSDLPDLLFIGRAIASVHL